MNTLDGWPKLMSNPWTRTHVQNCTCEVLQRRMWRGFQILVYMFLPTKIFARRKNLSKRLAANLWILINKNPIRYFYVKYIYYSTHVRALAFRHAQSNYRKKKPKTALSVLGCVGSCGASAGRKAPVRARFLGKDPAEARPTLPST